MTDTPPGSVFAGFNSGIIATGDGVSNSQLILPPGELKEPADVPCPPGVLNLRDAHGHLFVGREAELSQLEQALTCQQGMVILALTGLGGVGKSLLASHYAQEHAGDYSLIWTLSAQNEGQIQQDLAWLARRIHSVLDLMPTRYAANWALSWLASHPGWLLILDDVAEPAHAEALAAQLNHGTLLVTSRVAGGWQQLTSPIELGVLPPAAAVQLLQQLTNGKADADQALELCSALGHLPLAVEQAGAFITQSGMKAPDYLAQLWRAPEEVLADISAGRPRQAVSQTWHVTMQHIAEASPLAGRMLQAMAWFAPVGIPLSLPGPLGSPFTAPSALSQLARYSMIHLTGTETIDIHPLVQTVTRLPGEGLAEATALLVAALPGNERDPATWPGWRALIPHIDALAANAPEETDTGLTARLLTETGRFLTMDGRAAAAAHLLRRALATQLRLAGEQDPQAPQPRDALASRDVLASRDALECRDALAEALRAGGQLGAAITLHRQNAARSAELYGDQHPQTLRYRTNLGATLIRAGQLPEAESTLRGVFAAQERLLGAEHTDTLDSHHYLADALYRHDHYAEAKAHHDVILEIRSRLLGDDNPDTLRTRGDRANALSGLGDLTGAEREDRAVLAARLRVHGADHPRTLTSRSNLAADLTDQGKTDPGRYAEAESEHQIVLEARTRVLGPHHPDTLATRSNLAAVLAATGRPGEVLAEENALFAAHQETLGADHPDTLTSRSNRAETLADLHLYAEAEAEHRAVLEIRARVLDPEARETLISHGNWAVALARTGRRDDGIRELRYVVAARTRLFGPNDSQTIDAREDLAKLMETGQPPGGPPQHGQHRVLDEPALRKGGDAESGPPAARYDSRGP